MKNNYLKEIIYCFFLAFAIGLIPIENLSAAERDFSSSYYDIIAMVLLMFIFIALLSMILFEGRHKSLEKENRVISDHEYYKLREPDKKIPQRLSLLFYITIIIAVYYMFHFHVFSTGNGMKEEFAESDEIGSLGSDALKKSGLNINEDNVTELIDLSALESGKKIYDSNCIACHAIDGGGLVGPNLTDEYWIRGGGIKNIFKIIKYGVPEKGMISWETQLNASQIQEVASYIVSLYGTIPAAPKKPEGEKWEEAKNI